MSTTNPGLTKPPYCLQTAKNFPKQSKTTKLLLNLIYTFASVESEGHNKIIHDCYLTTPGRQKPPCYLQTADVQGVWKKFQMTNFTMPNNISSMKYALKLAPGLADVGVPHGYGPRTPPRCMEGVWKKCQII